MTKFGMPTRKPGTLTPPKPAGPGGSFGGGTTGPAPPGGSAEGEADAVVLSEDAGVRSGLGEGLGDEAEARGLGDAEGLLVGF
jgi:hypothetical protein